MTIMSHVHAVMNALGKAEINPTPIAPPGAAAGFNTLLGWVMWSTGAFGVLGFLAIAIRLMVSDNRESAMDFAKYFGRVCGGLILASAASGLARTFL